MTNDQQTNKPTNQKTNKPTNLKWLENGIVKERLKKMKLKIDWKALGKALWNAVKPVLLGAIGGGVIALTDGCSSLTPSSKTQSMGVYAIGVPGIAIITKSTQNEDASGGDNNAPTQVNPVTTTMTTGK